MRKKKKSEEVQIASLQFPDSKGGLSATFKHSGIAILASQYVKLFKELGGVNYLELSLEDKKSPEVGPFTVSIQRRDGLTAAEKATRLRTALEEIRTKSAPESVAWNIANEALEKGSDRKEPV